MAENYSAALSSILASLTSMCRFEDGDKQSMCKRELREKMLEDEVTRSTDPEVQKWKRSEFAELRGCYRDCQVRAKLFVKECNTRCLNSLVQSLWQRVNVSEYEKIVAKYA